VTDRLASRQTGCTSGKKYENEKGANREKLLRSIAKAGAKHRVGKRQPFKKPGGWWGGK